MVLASIRTKSNGNVSLTVFPHWLMNSIFVLLLLALNHVIGTKVVNVRQCSHEMRAKHITLAVGRNPSSEMIISFASTLSNVPAPIAGILVGTSPDLIGSINHMNSSSRAEANENDEVLLFLDNHNHGSPTSYNVSVGDEKYANVNKKRYYSPHYHHITVSNLLPSTVYYYKLLLHTRMESFNPYFQYLAKPKNESLNMETIFTKSSLLQLLRDADLSTSIADGNEIFTVGTSTTRDISNDPNNNEGGGHRQRQLIMWGPYDGSGTDCPDPDAIRSFSTAPPNRHETEVTDEKQKKATKIAVVGDLGQFPHSVETLRHMRGLKDQLDMILLVGDIAYTEDDHRQWDTFMDMLDDYGDLIHKLPLMIVPGNHDIDKLRHGTDIFLAYENRFRMPRIQEPILLGYHSEGAYESLNMDSPPYPLDYDYGNAYYSFPYGNAYFVMISAYSSMEPNSLQYNWVVKILESINRDQYPWVIVTLHTPMYNTFGIHHHDEQIVAAKRNIEPLLVLHRANFVFTGHIHAYLRTKNVAHGVVNETAPIHITVGAGGRKCDAPFESVEPEEWVEVRDATYYGYGTLTILNDTHSIWEWIHNGNFSDTHPYHNELHNSNITLPRGPETDVVYVQNQYYL